MYVFKTAFNVDISTNEDTQRNKTFGLYDLADLARCGLCARYCVRLDGRTGERAGGPVSRRAALWAGGQAGRRTGWQTGSNAIQQAGVMRTNERGRWTGGWWAADGRSPQAVNKIESTESRTDCLWGERYMRNSTAALETPHWRQLSVGWPRPVRLLQPGSSYFRSSILTPTQLEYKLWEPSWTWRRGLFRSDFLNLSYLFVPASLPFKFTTSTQARTV